MVSLVNLNFRVYYTQCLHPSSWAEVFDVSAWVKKGDCLVCSSSSSCNLEAAQIQLQHMNMLQPRVSQGCPCSKMRSICDILQFVLHAMREESRPSHASKPPPTWQLKRKIACRSDKKKEERRWRQTRTIPAKWLLLVHFVDVALTSRLCRLQ